MAGAAGIAAAASIIGNMIAGSQNYYYDRKMQQRAFKWQEKMSNTAHQREVEDLRKAGINPLYTATGGSGASTGSVGGSSNGVPSSDLGNIFLSGLSTMSNIKNQTNSTNADVELKRIQGEDLISNMQERVVRMAEMRSKMKLNDKQGHLIDNQIKQGLANIRQMESMTTFNYSNAKYTDDKNIRERNLTAGAQASSLNRYEQIKAHPTLSYMLDYLRGYNSQLK
ncbi:MAG: hypothetical protein IJY61_04295 [Candidatus Gastranaerophilales bacterium]|nr:hypothetical protein [Candidatus Gastranaerophilales bacterium]